MQPLQAFPPLHSFLAEKCIQLHPSRNDRILDFGCGEGKLLAYFEHHGYEAFGVDKFYDGGNYREQIKSKLGSSIFELEGDSIPFPSAHFDLVISTQVFEHVSDLQPALGEIWRVLKDNGTFIAVFPTREILREPHIGILLAHRMAHLPKLRKALTSIAYATGFGFQRSKYPRKEWVNESLKWIDNWTHYRPVEELLTEFSCFFYCKELHHEYLMFRLNGLGKVGKLASALAPEALLSELCLHWSTAVFCMQVKRPR